MPQDRDALAELGWSRHFEQQLDEDERERLVAARVFEVQRTGLVLRHATGELEVPLGGRWFQLPPEDRPTVGDWVLVERDRPVIARLLERRTLIKRMSAGRTGEVQLIAANVDTLLLVTSCNEDFNPSRLERYLALAHEAGVQPVVVLTKSDLAADADRYLAECRRLDPDLVVETVNATDPGTLAPLRIWCTKGQTVALLGSSGVGKSTLINSLSGERVAATGAIREADAKGRHTTTHRALHLLPAGGVLLDSPGMRELGVTDSDAGISATFGDVESLARRCRFVDCAHASEPGCAVRAAIEAGDLDERRLESYRKLRREEVYNTETVAERHARHRQWSKKVKQAAKTRDPSSKS